MVVTRGSSARAKRQALRQSLPLLAKSKKIPVRTNWAKEDIIKSDSRSATHGTTSGTTDVQWLEWEVEKLLVLVGHLDCLVNVCSASEFRNLNPKSSQTRDQIRDGHKVLKSESLLRLPHDLELCMTALKNSFKLRAKRKVKESISPQSTKLVADVASDADGGADVDAEGETDDEIDSNWNCDFLSTETRSKLHFVFDKLNG
ncbi:hypothetical protein B0H14DRAFT_2585311 [Mycena olivaceomarginata]|nr:hypothetical protein B0H14DRAFT_2585311 [Mycena olivaceomarginata]